MTILGDEPSLRVPVEPADLRRFVVESNRIEGINRAPLKRELDAHQRFLGWDAPSLSDLEAFVTAIAPGHYLRRAEGVNVRVGAHIAPPGGYAVQVSACHLLRRAIAREHPYTIHCDYETLHPFTDGNGRSGRALWLWSMLRREDDPWALHRGFLHSFYYQALASLSSRKDGSS
jgi:hypothetical protein